MATTPWTIKVDADLDAAAKAKAKSLGQSLAAYVRLTLSRDVHQASPLQATIPQESPRPEAVAETPPAAPPLRFDGVAHRIEEAERELARLKQFRHFRDLVRQRLSESEGYRLSGYSECVHVASPALDGRFQVRVNLAEVRYGSPAFEAGALSKISVRASDQEGEPAFLFTWLLGGSEGDAERAADSVRAAVKQIEGDAYDARAFGSALAEAAKDAAADGKGE